MLPASIFTLALGYISCKILGEIGGFFLALVIVYFAATIGSILAFLISRYLIRG
jgi:uncharacterized membrane protein YdjX (TVP38/TMEM64 family)